MYSHRHTSAITTSFGSSFFSACVARCTIPFSIQASVACSSFFSGNPNNMTAATPAACAARASSTAWSTERLNTPGIELTSLRTFTPGHTNNGSTNCSGANRVSRTIARNSGVLRKRRILVMGNAMASIKSACRWFGKIVFGSVSGRIQNTFGIVQIGGNKCCILAEIFRWCRGSVSFIVTSKDYWSNFHADVGITRLAVDYEEQDL